VFADVTDVVINCLLKLFSLFITLYPFVIEFIG